RRRKLWRDPTCGILELEAMAEHEGEFAGAVLAKVLLEIGWSRCLHVADFRAKAVADPKQPLIRAAVPRLIGDRSRRQQRHAECSRRGCIRGSAVAAATTRHERRCEHERDPAHARSRWPPRMTSSTRSRSSAE